MTKNLPRLFVLSTVVMLVGMVFDLPVVFILAGIVVMVTGTMMIVLMIQKDIQDMWNQLK